jgi:hypothetical protein
MTHTPTERLPRHVDLSIQMEHDTTLPGNNDHYRAINCRMNTPPVHQVFSHCTISAKMAAGVSGKRHEAH